MTELPNESNDSNKSVDSTESVTHQNHTDVTPEQPIPAYSRGNSKVDKPTHIKKIILVLFVLIVLGVIAI